MNLFYRWDFIAMLVALSVVLGFEMLGVFTTRYVTITWLTTHYIPRWALSMVWGWMGWHFLWRQL